MVLFSKDRILVPIDFSDASFKALEETLAFADASTVVHAIHVLSPLEPTDPGVVWQAVDADKREGNIRKAFAEKFPDHQEKVTFAVDTGKPEAKIIDYAKHHDIGLIVMPSQGRTGLPRFFLGSVTERVMRFSHCPVLVLRD